MRPTDSDAAPARPTKLELQAARLATAASLRAFAVGYVAPAGYVAGIEHLKGRKIK